jgi:hypothetical protein
MGGVPCLSDSVHMPPPLWPGSRPVLGPEAGRHVSHAGWAGGKCGRAHEKEDVSFAFQGGGRGDGKRKRGGEWRVEGELVAAERGEEKEEGGQEGAQEAHEEQAGALMGQPGIAASYADSYPAGSTAVSEALTVVSAPITREGKSYPVGE